MLKTTRPNATRPQLVSAFPVPDTRCRRFIRLMNARVDGAKTPVLQPDPGGGIGYWDGHAVNNLYPIARRKVARPMALVESFSVMDDPGAAGLSPRQSEAQLGCPSHSPAVAISGARRGHSPSQPCSGALVPAVWHRSEAVYVTRGPARDESSLRCEMSPSCSRVDARDTRLIFLSSGAMDG
jgi:hypothetical protein